MQYITPKQAKWRKVAPALTDYTIENSFEWPICSLRWGNVIQSNEHYQRQQIYMALRTDSHYDESN